MREIVSAEQPCILCGQLLEFTVVLRDDETGREEVRRDRQPHPTEDCLSFHKLYRETWPPSSSYYPF